MGKPRAFEEARKRPARLEKGARRVRKPETRRGLPRSRRRFDPKEGSRRGGRYNGSEGAHGGDILRHPAGDRKAPERRGEGIQHARIYDRGDREDSEGGFRYSEEEKKQGDVHRQGERARSDAALEDSGNEGPRCRISGRGARAPVRGQRRDAAYKEAPELRRHARGEFVRRYHQRRGGAAYGVPRHAAVGEH